MVNARYQPAVTETKVVQVESEKIILELTVEEATMLRTILGKFETGGPTSPVYHVLRRALPTNRFGSVKNRGRFPQDDKNVGVLLYTPPES